MVSRDTGETALLVAIGIVGFVGLQSIQAPELLAGAVLVVFGAVAPALRGEWRRREGA